MYSVAGVLLCVHHWVVEAEYCHSDESGASRRERGKTDYSPQAHIPDSSSNKKAPRATVKWLGPPRGLLAGDIVSA